MSYYIDLLENEKNVDAFMRQQESAGAITLMGPTSSAKSTLITELLPPESNKLLSHNIGDTAQTTLIPTMLMLNNRFSKTEVLVKCIARKSKELYPEFLESLKTTLTDVIYEERDDLDDFSIAIEHIEKILNPTNRAFHVYKFAEENGLINNLNDILNTACNIIIKSPDLIVSAANIRYKQMQTMSKKKPGRVLKKKESYEELIDERLSNDAKSMKSLEEWFVKLEKYIKKSLNNIWTYSEELVVLSDLQETVCNVSELIEKIYKADSPYSLIFEEVRYATCPSNGFEMAFNNRNAHRTVKLNILDTVGITQTSQDRNDISENMDAILNRKSDAILFLCSADEQPVVYETCIELLKEKKKAISNKPVVVCRTKADIVILNKIRNLWRLEHGTNLTPQESGYGEYVKTAHNSFVEEYITIPKFGEDSLGNGTSEIEYLSLTPDSTDNMKQYLNGELEPSKLFDILMKTSIRIDAIYANGKYRPWLSSTKLSAYPLNVKFTGSQLLHTIATALVTKDSQNGNQYKKYITDTDVVYHGRSVNCFRRKLSYGEGHETNAFYYGNFSLYITNMVSRWLREVVPEKELINNFKIDRRYLYSVNDTQGIADEQFIRLLHRNWNTIIWQIAKDLSYTSLSDDFEQCFYGFSWSAAFRKSLSVISDKFSDVKYWEKQLDELLKQKADELLQKMYIFD